MKTAKDLPDWVRWDQRCAQERADEAEEELQTAAALRAVLDDIHIAPCAGLQRPLFEFEEISTGWLVWLSFEGPDRDTGTIAVRTSRREYVPAGALLSSVVKTAWLLLELATRHESMEGFIYRGSRIFDPHRTVAELAGPGPRS